MHPKVQVVQEGCGTRPA